MTREEQTDWLCRLRAYLNNGVIVTPLNKEFTEALTGILEQEPKIGHWIVIVAKWGDTVTTVNGYRCSECNAFNMDEDNYCPNCGAKMRAESEVEYGKNES